MDQDADDSLFRSVVGSLRAAIHDHGPITLDRIGSAAKRVVGNLRNAADVPKGVSREGRSPRRR